MFGFVGSPDSEIEKVRGDLSKRYVEILNRRVEVEDLG